MSRDGRIGVLICYEGMYPSLGRAYRAAGADALLVLTNDSWWGRSVFPAWHARMVSARARELDLPVLRAANSGVSSMTDRFGATRASTSMGTPEQHGGGVWGVSSNATVANCILQGNSAGYNGGGAYRVTLKDCILNANTAVGDVSRGSGGAAAYCNLRNCIIKENVSSSGGGGLYYSYATNCALLNNVTRNYGGGAYYGMLRNCTVSGNVVGNSSTGSGGGVASVFLTNCVVYGNMNLFSQFASTASNYFSSTFSYSCSAPLPSGAGNGWRMKPQDRDHRWNVEEGVDQISIAGAQSSESQAGCHGAKKERTLRNARIRPTPAPGR